MGSLSRSSVRRTTGDDRMVAGVASGLGRAFGVDPVLVRLAFVLLAFAGGAGVVAYAVGALLIPEGEPGDGAALDDGAALADGRTVEQAVGVGLMTVGCMLLLRRAGLLLPDEVVWPMAVIVVGMAIAWTRVSGRPVDLLDSGRGVVVRLVAGSALLAIGIGVFAALNERLVVATQVVIAVVVAAGGVALLAGPWILRLGRQLGEERTERIRADERAELAAHLHDSVLQTLALIQRRADSPSETVALARRQERELRDWLNGDRRALDAATVAGALRSLADEVEADHPIVVDVVTVGDALLTDDLRALVAATREATVNAAKHSGADTVSVYVEVDDDEVTAFVRDRGRGFDPDAVPEGRHGLAESVIGRVQRHHGRADVQSSPGHGAEITLVVRRRELTA